MSAKYFKKEVIVTDAAYPRQYPRSTINPDDRLELVINKFTPLSNPNPGKNDLSIVYAHATGFQAELYEGLMDDIFVLSQSSSFKIRAIYAFQAVQHGASGVRNEKKLGDTCK